MQEAAAREYHNSPLHVEHALTGLQLRVNTAKHMEAGIAVLASAFFAKRSVEIKEMKVVYFGDPTPANAAPLIELCENTRRML